jgi:hypothetical protein
LENLVETLEELWLIWKQRGQDLMGGAQVKACGIGDPRDVSIPSAIKRVKASANARPGPSISQSIELPHESWPGRKPNSARSPIVPRAV